MQAVIDPDNLTVVGFVPEGAFLCEPWASFITVPVPEGADQETLGVESDGQGGYTFITDPAKVQAQKDAQTAQNKAKRNQLLAQSDWSTLSDVPLTNKAEWLEYRSALRAVDLTEPVWPQEPSVVWSQV